VVVTVLWTQMSKRDKLLSFYCYGLAGFSKVRVRFSVRQVQLLPRSCQTVVQHTGSYDSCLTQQPSSQPGNHAAGLATAFIHVFIHASRCIKFHHCSTTVTAPALRTTFYVVREYPNKGYVLHGKKKNCG